jgi:hypothetical protein
VIRGGVGGRKWIQGRRKNVLREECGIDGAEGSREFLNGGWTMMDRNGDCGVDSVVVG